LSRLGIYSRDPKGGTVSDIHITHELLAAVERGEIPARVLTEVGWNHLLHLCPTCNAGFQSWQRRRHDTGVGYDSAFRVLPVVLERHTHAVEEAQQKARKDLRALLRLSHSERLLRIQRSLARFRGVMLAHLLVGEAKRHMPAEPETVHELAEAAEAVLLRTPQASGYYDALARAIAYKANALRALGRFPEADERIRSARSLVRNEEVTDNLVYAEIDWFEGVLRKDQRRFRDAEELLARSASLFQLAGERIDSARPLLTLGAMYHHRQEPGKAIETTEAALAHLSPEAEPHLYLCGRHNLALFLVEQGKFDAAADLLQADAELYERFADPWTALRQVWLQGKIAFATWRLEEAEQAFLEVRHGFTVQGNGYDAAMVSLDLALLYLKEGRTAEVQAIAAEMHTLFGAQEIHREATAALLLFQEAAEREALTAEWVEDLTAYLKRARENPELRFIRQLKRD
jgi:tetratricopeptide (TPR) repeat protein